MQPVRIIDQKEWEKGEFWVELTVRQDWVDISFNRDDEVKMEFGGRAPLDRIKAAWPEIEEWIKPSDQEKTVPHG